jgi:protein involved in polysaccharide export with SLBB domain
MEASERARPRRSGFALLGACAAVLAAGWGCPARYSVNPAAFQASQGPSLRAAATLDVSDVVEVRVLGESELSGTFRVSETGAVSLPMIGVVHVRGLTPLELEKELRKRLADGYLKHPQVTVFVKEFNSKKIYVFGEVGRPGTFRYEPGMNIIQAITLAGGFTRTAWKNRTHVTRIIGGTERRIEVPVEAIGEGAQKNFLLRPGDIVFVPESPL